MAIISVVTMIVILILLGIQLFSVWTNYSNSLGQKSSTNYWLESRLNSRALDIYDFAFAIQKLQIACFQYKNKQIYDYDLFNQILVVSGMFESFSKDTKLSDSLQHIKSYPEAKLNTRKFLDNVILFEKNKIGIDLVNQSAQDSIDSLLLLKSDAITIEFNTRDQIANAVKSFQDVIDLIKYRIVTLFLMCVVAIYLFSITLIAYWRSQQRRFNRFEWLVASIGHDLRSPLQILKSANHMLTKNISSQDKERYFLMINKTIDNLSSLIDDMLLVVRREELSLVNSYIDLEKWFSFYIQTYKLKNNHSELLNIKSSINVDSMFIEIDEKRLAQCITNLLDNAFRYTSKGIISIDVKLAPGLYKEKNRLLLIQVADTGQGINPQDQERIFDPFERATHVGQKQGKGLGLSIVRHIMNGMHGNVYLIQSKLNEGSIFQLAIPVNTKNKRETSLISNETQTIVQSGAKRQQSVNVEIILVDDDKNIIDSLEAVLLDAGFRVLATTDPGIALLSMSNHHVKILITDIEMKEMDGFSLAKNARKIRPDLFITAMTAHTLNLDQSEFRFDAILYKPVSLDELLAVIDKSNLENNSI